MDELLLDRAGEQRSSEKIDAATLEHYLRSHEVISSSIKKIQQFDGGASNLTYRVITENDDLILRRPPFGKKAKSAHDMQREVNVLSALAPHFSCCPNFRHYCGDDKVIGSDFYLMERIEGVIIRRAMPEGVKQSPRLHERMCQEFLDKLVELHSIDADQVGLSEFGKPQGYVERQVSGWIQRLEAVVTKDTIGFSSLTDWLRDHMPADHEQSSIIHNDFKFDNVIWSAQSLAQETPKIIGVLDWEMSTLGDPLMDLGGTLSYWIQADDSAQMRALSMMPTHLDGMLNRRQVADYYLQHRQWPEASLEYYRIFGLFRLAVIVQQIFYRFDLGQSDNPKFAPFGHMANVLIQTAMDASKG